MAREHLPHRSTLSRFLAALNQAVVEALRTVFLARSGRWASRKGGKSGRGVGRASNTLAHLRALVAPDKLPANVPCPLHLIFHRHTAAWTRSVLQATQDTGGVKPLGPGPPCCRPIRINGSARFPGHQVRATAKTSENCGKP